MLRLRLPVVLCLMLALLLGACDSGNGGNDIPNVAQGRFTVEIEGDVNETLDGFAFFGDTTNPDTDEEVFGVFLSSTNAVSPSGRWVVLGRSGERPGTGTYAFTDVDPNSDELDDLPADAFVLVVSFPDGQTPRLFYSSAGELTITTSTSARFAGTFEVAVDGLTFSGGETQVLDGTLTGTFDATPSDQFVLPFD